MDESSCRESATDQMVASSPDPLGAADENLGIESTSKPKRPNISPRKPLMDATGNARIQEFYVSTPPAKSYKTSATKGKSEMGDVESPWHIRLTVQAERVEGHDTTLSPNRLTERTTTTTVPLKFGDDGVPAEKKSRGRPRKSLENPVKRNGTPNPKAALRRKTMPETSTEGSEFSWVPTPPKKGRPRGRKTLPRAYEKSPLAVDTLGSQMITPARQTPERTIKARPFSRTRSRNRRKEITPRKILQQAESGSEESRTETPSNMSDTRQVRLNDTLLPGQSHSTEQETSHDSSQGLLSDISEPAVSSLERSTLDIEDEKMWRSMIRQDSVSPAGVVAAGKNIGGSTGSLELDPTDQHLEFDTILESEGFSMVSVESLQSTSNKSGGRTSEDKGSSRKRSTPSVVAHSSPPTLVSGVESPLPLPHKKGALVSSGKETAPQGASNISNYFSSELHTPESLMTMPLMPSKPVPIDLQTCQRTIDEPTDGTPKIDRVVRAGVALQAVPSPSGHVHSHCQHTLASPFSMSRTPAGSSKDNSPRSDGIESSSIPSSRASGMFDGFSAASRRELRAGLRLGEELAKRQRSTLSTSDGNPDLEPSINQVQHSLSYPQLSALELNEPPKIGGSTIEQGMSHPTFTNTQLPSPQKSDVDEDEYHMSWKADAPASVQLTISNDNVARSGDTVDHSMLAKEAEWQREREAVSKQIQEANSSQVIVIDSGDEESSRDSASNASQRLPSEGENVFPAMGSSEMSIRLEMAKSRRSKLPSPWRRNTGEVYSDEIQPNDSDMFWQPDVAQVEAVKKRQERRRQIQTSQDSSALSLTEPIAKNDPVPSLLTPGTPEPKPDNMIATNDTDLLAILKTPGSDEDSVSDDTYCEESDAQSQCDSEYFSDSSEELTEDCIQPTLELMASETSISLAQGESAASVPLPDSPYLAPIDPRLLGVAKESETSTKLKPTQDGESTEASGSWFGMLTAPLTSLFKPRFSLPPMTESDILIGCCEKPLPLYQPWTTAHADALKRFIHVSVFYTPELLPYNSRSQSAFLLGATVTVRGNWARKITKGDCGVIDGFLLLLRHRGIAPKGGWNLWERGQISIREIAVRVVEYWVFMVTSGSVKKGDWKGVKVGLRRAGDRTWTEGDIDWEDNMNAYFEEKRALFEKYGLPSWKAKGLVGPFKLP